MVLADGEPLARHPALADSRPSPAWDFGAVLDEIGDDDRRREEEQAEDEVPDEAVALPASDTGGPERDRDPDDSKQDPPKGGHSRLLSQRSHGTLYACCRTAASAPTTLPHRAVLRTTQASPQEG